MKQQLADALGALAKANLKLSVSYEREFSELIEEIAIRDSLSCGQVIKLPDVLAIINHPKLTAPQKIKKIKEVLMARRYPTAFSAHQDSSQGLGKLPKNFLREPGFKLSKIIVEKSVSDEPLTKKILTKFNNLPLEYVDEVKLKKAGFKPGELLIARQKGRFIKKCPCTPKHHSCNYYVLNLGIGCSFNCTYCFLHQYMNTPFMVYANTADLIKEVGQFSAKNPDKTFRLGSGEFIDSVDFDVLTGLNEVLIPALSQNKNILFEVKTKSSRIEHLLNLKHNGRVVVSWSLNTEAVIKRDEQAAAPLKERLRAAQMCQEAGYKIGFHFDPLIYYKDWKRDYRRVAEQLFEHVNPQNIVWISLGALRFNPSLKPIIKRKFPRSRLVYGELLPGSDGKLRYPKTIRQKMFAQLAGDIHSYSKKVPVYLCMESAELAKEVKATARF